ncbi:hypothetical protein [Salarchaeum sp. JOR-1]|uniref:DUF7472 family protein n=1 Tax=Salarchaeum sp. JOR-1 TaxID=2599399 RepID=UPI001198BA3C|nr:hypothetical protein [Salarchaeum sp. JOR-1]QDX40124.1 hypothetical protein FQU85_04170 [Salarchaeum sp. JOR-1]
MAFEREKLVEAAWASLGVVVFIAALVGTASMSGASLGRQGTFAVIGSLVLFLVLMGGIGVYLSTRD